MAELTQEKVAQLVHELQGQRITLDTIRHELNILKGTKAYDNVRVYIKRLVEERKLRPLGGRGEYKVVTQVQPVTVFGKERRQPVTVIFPKDKETEMELPFAQFITLREGDSILLSGLSNYGKTALCLNLCAENLDMKPVLMGNEYTQQDEFGNYNPSSRFLDRIDRMDWVKWYDDNHNDRFTLLPVDSDYAEHVVKDRLNIIDWIDIASGEHYMIGTILKSIKRELGRGIAVVAIQKSEGASAGRGGQFTKDYADVELLLDRLPETKDVLCTIGKVKESLGQLTGRTYAWHIDGGISLRNVREVIKCKKCWGKGWVGNKPCDECLKSGYVNK